MEEKVKKSLELQKFVEKCRALERDFSFFDDRGSGIFGKDGRKGKTTEASKILMENIFLERQKGDLEGNIKLKNDVLETMVQNRNVRHEAIRYFKKNHRLLKKTLGRISLENKEHFPLVAFIFRLAQISGCDLTYEANQILKKTKNENILRFFILAYLVEFPLSCQFSQRSRRISGEAQGEFIRVFSNILDEHGWNSRNRGRKERNTILVETEEGHIAVPIRLGGVQQFFSSRFLITFILQRAVSLFFMEDTEYRENSAKKLLELNNIALGNGKGEEHGALIFLKTLILMAWGEDERAMRHLGKFLFPDGDSRKMRFNIVNTFLLGKIALWVAEHGEKQGEVGAEEMARWAGERMLEAGNGGELGTGLVLLSNIARKKGELDMGRNMASAALEIFSGLRIVYKKPSALFALAENDLDNGEYKQSRKYFKMGKGLSRKYSDEMGYARGHVGLARVALRMDRRREAKNILKEIVQTTPIKQYPHLFEALKAEVIQYDWLRVDRDTREMFVTQNAIKIRKELVENIIAFARDSYPNEFGAVIRGKEVLENMELLYSSQVNRSSVMFSRYDGAGSRISVDGFVHSHPSGAAIPSRADLRSFGLFVNNLIIGYPFTADSIAAYDRVGNRLELIIID